jgi:hypothetical protein
MSDICQECGRLKKRLGEVEALLIEKANRLLMVQRAVLGAYCDFSKRQDSKPPVEEHG